MQFNIDNVPAQSSIWLLLIRASVWQGNFPPFRRFAMLTELLKTYQQGSRDKDFILVDRKRARRPACVPSSREYKWDQYILFSQIFCCLICRKKLMAIFSYKNYDFLDSTSKVPTKHTNKSYKWMPEPECQLSSDCVYRSVH